MKNRILTFIIGVLTGAIIIVLIFPIIINPNEEKNIGDFPLNENGQMGRPNENMGNPPAKPESNMQMPVR